MMQVTCNLFVSLVMIERLPRKTADGDGEFTPTKAVDKSVDKMLIVC